MGCTCVFLGTRGFDSKRGRHTDPQHDASESSGDTLPIELSEARTLDKGSTQKKAGPAEERPKAANNVGAIAMTTPTIR